MTLHIVVAVGLGIFMGLAVFPESVIVWFDGVVGTALGVLLLGVGIELGQNRQLIDQMRRLGKVVFVVPAAVAIGSIGGAACAGAFLGLPLNEASAIGAGFGWYSLSSIIIADIYRIDTGALAFLTNVTRELFAVLMIPLVARRVGKLAAVAPGGATTMDVTLPLVAKATDSQTTVIAFLSGAILSFLVPILVPILIRWGV